MKSVDVLFYTRLDPVVAKVQHSSENFEELNQPTICYL